MRNLRIVFMGTPDFAVPMLQALHASPHQVVAVVTAPDKPAGRGLKMHESAVKRKAKELGLKILQPEKLRDENFLSELRALQADLFVVVAFRMLPEVVWSMPPLGSINLHASLLPQYRGAAPIQRAIMNGETETGVTTFFLQHEIDTGKIIFQEKIPITDNDTGGTVYEKLKTLGTALLLKTVNAIAAGDYPQIPQEHIKDIHHAPKIFTEDCRIDWRLPARCIYNHIRALNPHPGAFTTLQGKIFKILRAQVEENLHGPPGTIATDGKTYLTVYCGEGALKILECQPEGKRLMTIAEYLRGAHLHPALQLN
ncbi:MAG: methionyl-tRNA formyltransferase [Chitinophagales bacterium]|nr:methionyl-tRNA formyltransferase [Chitinophagales bacterium]